MLKEAFCLLGRFLIEPQVGHVIVDGVFDRVPGAPLQRRQLRPEFGDGLLVRQDGVAVRLTEIICLREHFGLIAAADVASSKPGAIYLAPIGSSAAVTQVHAGLAATGPVGLVGGG